MYATNAVSSWNPYPNAWQGVNQAMPYPQPQAVPAAQNTPQMWPQVQRAFGRTVNSAGDITPQEVPMDGNLSLFPLADGSAIIGKRWTSDGKLQEMRFIPEQTPPQQEHPNFNEYVIQRLDNIEDSLEQLVSGKQTTRKTRKVVNDDVDTDA